MRPLALLVVALLAMLLGLPPTTSAVTSSIEIAGGSHLDQIDWESFLHEFTRVSGIKATYRPYPRGTTLEELSDQLRSGVGPDVLLSGPTILHYARERLVLPLDRYLAGWDGRSQIPPNLYVRDPQTGQTYGITYGVWIYEGKIYNPQVFARYGIDPDTPPSTWDELLAVTERTTQYTGSQAITVGFESSQWNLVPEGPFRHFLMETGSNLLSDDYRQIQFHESNGLRAAQLVSDLYRISYPEGYEISLDWDNWMRRAPPRLDYLAGRIAILRTGNPPSLLAQLMADRDPSWAEKTRYFVTRPDRQTTPLVNGTIWTVGIPITAKDPMTSWQFIEWFLSSDAMARFSYAEGTIPGRIDTYSEMQENSPSAFVDGLLGALPYVKPVTPAPSGLSLEFDWSLLSRALWDANHNPDMIASRLTEIGALFQRKLDRAWAGAQNQELEYEDAR